MMVRPVKFRVPPAASAVEHPARYRVEALPEADWRTCPVCGGTGQTEMTGDAHRSPGIIPCPNMHCAGGVIKSHSVVYTPEPVKAEPLQSWYSVNWLDLKPEARQLKNRALFESAKRMIEEGGGESHSAMGATLQLQLRRLEEARVPYTLKAVPGMGYYLSTEPRSER